MNHALCVLITCRELAVRAGSQLYTRDVAEALRELGHSPVVYSPRLGEVAAEMRARGVAVIDDLDRLGGPPDVIHGQHHLEAMAALLRFPGVPALYVCHGWLPWHEAPPRFPSLLQYVAVDTLRRDRLVLEHAIPEERVAVLPNFVDLDRFRPRPPLPPRPGRALLLSNQATAHNFTREVERACSASGLELTVAGAALGLPTSRPEELLASFDLVFARGRAALEAMAVGAAVVLCDLEGCGLLVDTANFGQLRDLNFGLGALRPPVAAERLQQEIARYDPAEAQRVRDRVRGEAGRREAVARLVDLYRELRAAAPDLAGAEHDRRCLAAGSRYVSWLSPHLEELEARWETAASGRAEAESRLAATRADLESLRRSPFFRLRARLHGVRPLVAAYRAVRGRDRGPR
ncbi:MAG TPA: glycosyltransferase [Thermoanaerobaculia bacterium]|nr:glycosyltransferase [Thermoanaerobaculia bacterium]